MKIRKIAQFERDRKDKVAVLSVCLRKRKIIIYWLYIINIIACEETLSLSFSLFFIRPAYMEYVYINCLLSASFHDDLKERALHLFLPAGSLDFSPLSSLLRASSPDLLNSLFLSLLYFLFLIYFLSASVKRVDDRLHARLSVS